MTRSEHLAWSKKRALEYLDQPTPDPDDGRLRIENPTPPHVVEAFKSMCSDLSKHDELRGHPGMELGLMEMLLPSGMNARRMRDFIEGFN